MKTVGLIWTVNLFYTSRTCQLPPALPPQPSTPSPPSSLPLPTGEGSSTVSPLTPGDLLIALHNIDSTKCDMKSIIKGQTSGRRFHSLVHASLGLSLPCAPTLPRSNEPVLCRAECLHLGGVGSGDAATDGTEPPTHAAHAHCHPVSYHVSPPGGLRHEHPVAPHRQAGQKPITHPKIFHQVSGTTGYSDTLSGIRQAEVVVVFIVVARRHVTLSCALCMEIYI